MRDNEMNTIEAIIFDLDGLMIDSEPLARQAWSRVLESYHVHLDNETFSRMIGLRLEESSKLVRDIFNLDASPSELAELEQRNMSRIMARGIPTMPGLDRLLSEIAGRGIPWAIATSSRRSYAISVLDHMVILNECQAIAAGDEVASGKPAPDVYLLAAQRIGIDASRCLALEDSVPGIKAAASAGMKTVAVPNGDTSPMDFADADYIYDSLNEVADNLDKLLKFRD
jgi:HAD superfamily hydrolase (TIGR01509 family)